MIARLLVLVIVSTTTAHAEPTDGEKIRQTIRSAKRPMARCYTEHAGPVKPGYKFEFAIRKDGRVTRTTFRTGNSKRDACLLKLFMRLVFPALSSDVVISYPLNADPA